MERKWRRIERTQDTGEERKRENSEDTGKVGIKVKIKRR